ncbi:hypothetical protein ACFSC4_13415 [Deinococcus malanensis]|uniref:ATP-binding protein n=1 Tax=Deinococcus malanensis TaxID=1706855 RepID=UPI00362E8448
MRAAPVNLSAELLARVKADTERLALELGVRGLMNVQWAVKDGTAYILEANPRASRTVPFVSKAVNHPLAKSAARIAVGHTLEQIGLTATPEAAMYSVKEVHLPFLKFKGVSPILGPEMKSTGESMGIDADPYLAFYRAQLGAKSNLPLSGTALLLGEGLDEVAATLGKAGLSVIREQQGEQLPDLLIDITGSPCCAWPWSAAYRSSAPAKRQLGPVRLLPPLRAQSCASAACRGGRRRKLWLAEAPFSSRAQRQRKRGSFHVSSASPCLFEMRPANPNKGNAVSCKKLGWIAHRQSAPALQLFNCPWWSCPVH